MFTVAVYVVGHGLQGEYRIDIPDPDALPDMRNYRERN